MTSQPFFSGLSAKSYNFALIAMVTLMYIGLCAEADMYVPAFPQMIQYFGVAENKIQLILSLNFGGLCVAGLVTGPLSDSFGRRPVLLVGLSIFVLSSFGCLYSTNFHEMLFWRFLQGISASVPMVVGMATFLDKYTQEKAGQLIGMLNGVIAASMAGAPIAGAWVSHIWGWRANFLVILVLALVTFVGTWLFVEETLPENQRKAFQGRYLVKDYIRLAANFEFIIYSILAMSAFTAVIVYVANLSVIFVNHMGMGLAEFSYWQATTMGTYIIFSLISAKIIGAKGLAYTQYLGSFIALIGAAALFAVGHMKPNNPSMICLSMAFIAAGGAIFTAPFGLKAMSIFPDMKGAAGAMMTAVRQSLAAGLVVLSEMMFDGSITPVATIVFGLAVVCTVLYGLIWLQQPRPVMKQ